MAQLMMRGLRKSFGDVAVLHGIDLEIQDGEFVVFVGERAQKCGLGVTHVGCDALHRFAAHSWSRIRRRD